LSAARDAIVADGFTVGVVTGPVTGLVVIQSPAKGDKANFHSPIDLTLEAPPTTTISCP
jgi:hypothetical protein